MVVILFWFYDVLEVTHELNEYSVLVRFWLYFNIMTIAAEPIILNFFLPWIKHEDDSSIDDRQDKYVRSGQEQEMVNPLETLKVAISHDVKNYEDLQIVKKAVDHKQYQHFEEDFHAVVVLCFLKSN